jgi:hypothetical protein
MVDKSVKYKLVLTPSRCKVWPFDSTSATGYHLTWTFLLATIQTREKKILIRLAGKYKNVEELRNLVVSSKNGIQVRLRILPMFKMDKKQLKRLLVLIKRAPSFYKS